MKSLSMALFVLVAAGLAGQAAASPELAKSKNCMGCHAVERKMVGPAYKDVAAKYKGDKSAEAKLVEKVQKGGVGAWGQVPMPPNPQVNAAEAKTLVAWVLAQK